jgi:hypothetical protein
LTVTRDGLLVAIAADFHSVGVAQNIERVVVVALNGDVIAARAVIALDDDPVVHAYRGLVFYASRNGHGAQAIGFGVVSIPFPNAAVFARPLKVVRRTTG